MILENILDIFNYIFIQLYKIVLQLSHNPSSKFGQQRSVGSSIRSLPFPKRMQSHYRVNQSPSTIPPRERKVSSSSFDFRTHLSSPVWSGETFEARPVKRFARNSIYPRHSGTCIYTHGSMKDSSVTQNARGSPRWTSAFQCRRNDQGGYENTEQKYVSFTTIG